MPDELTPEQTVQQGDDEVRQEIVEAFNAKQDAIERDLPPGTQHPDAGQQEAAPEEPRFAPEVERMAQDYGFTPEILRSFQTEDDLLAAMASLDRKVIEQSKAQQQQAVQQWQQHAQQTMQQPQQQVPQQVPQQPQQQMPGQLMLDELTEDDPIRKNFEYLGKTYQALMGQIQQVSQYLAQQHRLEHLRQFNQYTEQFESQLDGSGFSIYGNRRERSLTPEQLQNRQEALAHFQPLLQYEFGRNPYRMDTGLLTKRAMYAAHMDKVLAEKAKQRTDQIRERSSQRSGGQSRLRYTPPGALGTTPVTREQDLYPSQDPEFMAKVYDMVENRV